VCVSSLPPKNFFSLLSLLLQGQIFGDEFAFDFLPICYYAPDVRVGRWVLGADLWGEGGGDVVELAVYDIYLYLRKICELLLLLLQMGVECGGYD
jgi:hypothetical protein